jgi:hypothetical protein
MATRSPCTPSGEKQPPRHRPDLPTYDAAAPQRKSADPRWRRSRDPRQNARQNYGTQIVRLLAPRTRERALENARGIGDLHSLRHAATVARPGFIMACLARTSCRTRLGVPAMSGYRFSRVSGICPWGSVDLPTDGQQSCPLVAIGSARGLRGACCSGPAESGDEGVEDHVDLCSGGVRIG